MRRTRLQPPMVLQGKLRSYARGHSKYSFATTRRSPDLVFNMAVDLSYKLKVYLDPA